MSRKITVWQCKDWCCEWKPFPKRWWNARIQGRGAYYSDATPTGAYAQAVGDGA